MTRDQQDLSEPVHVDGLRRSIPGNIQQANTEQNGQATAIQLNVPIRLLGQNWTIINAT